MIKNMKLIICEKPDLAKGVVHALNHIDDMIWEDGYYEGNDYIVAFALGHLFEQYDIEDYFDNPEAKWSLDILPYVPEQFKITLKRKRSKGKKQVDSNIRDLFALLCDLMNRDDVTEIISCGDSDREGEVLIREIIYSGLKSKKTLSRLWQEQTTDEVVLEALEKRKPITAYNDLYNEGLARMYMDWLLGINYTRACTLFCNGVLFRIGRLVSAIVDSIYVREQKIKQFVPETYYQVEGKSDSYHLTVTTNDNFSLEERDAATHKAMELNQFPCKVVKVEKKLVTKQSKKLYSLNTVSAELAKKHKFSMDKTLEVIQKLYIAGYLSYPRTNTEYMGESEKDRVKQVLKVFEADYDVVFKDTKRVFDDSKIEAHSALIPTVKVPDIASFSEDEVIVYETIRNRFLAVFCSRECKVAKTEIILEQQTNAEPFQMKLSGNTIVEQGFLTIDKQKVTEKELPALVEGDVITDLQYDVVEKRTSPPKHYTTESLILFLERPFKTVHTQSDDEAYKLLLSGCEIGTVATRPVAIKNAIDCGYIKLEKDSYSICEKGVFMVEMLKRLGIDFTVQKTVEMNRLLNRVYQGELSVAQVVETVKKELVQSMSHISKEDITYLSEKSAVFKESQDIGDCPKCNSKVREYAKVYACTNQECKFCLFKEDKYFASFGKQISSSMASHLLKDKKVLVTGIKSKKNPDKKYSAYISVDFSEEYPKYDMKLKKGKMKFKYKQKKEKKEDE